MVSVLAVGASIVLYDGSPLVPSANVLWDIIDQIGYAVFTYDPFLITSISIQRLYFRCTAEDCHDVIIKRPYSLGNRIIELGWRGLQARLAAQPDVANSSPNLFAVVVGHSQ